MTKLDPKLQARVINLALDEFADQLQEILRQKLTENQGNVPSSTISNLSYRIIAAQATNLVAKHELIFQDSGRIVDMKNLQPGRPANIEAIRAWAKKKGIDAFKFVPGYKMRKPEKLEDAKQIERIAAAISFSRAKGVKKKRKQQKLQAWLNSNYYRAMNQFLVNIQNKQADYLKIALANEFKENMGKIEL